MALSVVVKRLRPRGSSWRTDPSREGRRAVSDRAEGLSGLVESWASAELAGDVGFLRARPGRRGDGVRGDVAHAPGSDPPWRGIGCPSVSPPDGPHADIAHLGPSGERALRARAPRQRRSRAGEPGAPTRRCAPGLPSTRAPAPLRGRHVRARASTFGRGRRRSSRYCPARLMSSGRESKSARAWKPSGAMVATGLRPSHCIRWTTTPAGRKSHQRGGCLLFRGRARERALVRVPGVPEEASVLHARGGTAHLAREMPAQWINELAVAGDPDECARGYATSYRREPTRWTCGCFQPNGQRRSPV